MKQILLVDDHAMIRNGIRRILQELLADTVEIFEASTGQEAINMVQNGCYSLVLLDISLPDRNGLDILHQISQHCSNTPVIMLSMHPERHYAVRSLRAGAMGYLTKESAADELILAVEKVLQGGQYINPSVAELLVKDIQEEKKDVPPHTFLSDREFQVVCMISAGKTPTEISSSLCLSVKTISTYRTRILEKLKLNSNADIFNYCRDHNLAM